MAQARFEEVRDRYAKCVEQRQPLMIAAMVAEQIGLCDASGYTYTREDGAPTLAPREQRKRLPKEFHPAVLAEAIIGRNWKQALGLERSGKLFDFTEIAREASRQEGRDVRSFAEEAAAPMGPSVWANVAAWSATVGGLMGAQFQLGYETAQYELADLFPVRPAVFWQGGERIIDIIGPYMPAQKTAPGEQYADNSMSAMWVECGQMYKYAGMVSVTKETAEIDISGGQLLAKANQGGDTLKLREMILSLDAIVGNTNNFKLGMLTDSSATAYNTYGPTITSPQGRAVAIPNDFVNPLNDVGAFQISDKNIAELYHPVTDYPLVTNLDTAIFPTPLAAWANWLNGVEDFTGLTQTTAGPAQPAPGTFPTAMLGGKNPWRNTVKPVVSRWLHDLHIRSTTQTDPNLSAGLGLTGAGIYRWYRCDPAKFACRRQKWAANSQSVNPGDWVMLTQGIVAAHVWDMATMVQILSPFHIQRNKAA